MSDAKPPAAKGSAAPDCASWARQSFRVPLFFTMALYALYYAALPLCLAEVARA